MEVGHETQILSRPCHWRSRRRACAVWASCKVLEVDRQFVASGASSFWAICVVYLHGEITGQVGRSKIDYKEVLTPAEFELYTKLRDLRKNLSERDAVPAYAIFTNEQLAALVRQRVTTASSMEETPGIGAGRGGRYGEPFLQVLERARRAAAAGIFPTKRIRNRRSPFPQFDFRPERPRPVRASRIEVCPAWAST